MTYAILYGVKTPPPKTFAEGWYTLIEHYGDYDSRRKDAGPDTASGDGDRNTLGFWCAVGASGADGVPDLTGFPLGDFEGASETHRAALAKAKEGWDRFVAWCAEPHNGVTGKRKWKTPALTLPPARLYLVVTEVA